MASNNEGKLRELKALCAREPQLRSLQLLSARDVNLPQVVEDADTFQGNAVKKALAAAKATGLIALADDSGLEVDALGGRPGVHSARYAADASGKSTDEENIAKLLQELANIADRKARFRCVVAIATPQGQVWTAEGTCEGEITTQPLGQGGFGYDPIFLVAGLDKTMAELAEDEKNQLSHRARAFAKALPILKELVRAKQQLEMDSDT